MFTNSLPWFVHFQRLAPPLWIPVTPVITADGCNDWGDENDGGRPKPVVPTDVRHPPAVRIKEGGDDLPAVILAEPSRPAEGGTTRFGGNPEERAAKGYQARLF